MAAASAAPERRHVFRWDLDKTYLRSEFSTFTQLLKSAFEKAEDKRAVPGAPALLRALRRERGALGRICIVSGSPTQMRTVLEKRLQLDGVEYDEFVLKPNLENMLRGRFRAVREQVGYKLPALLLSRAQQPKEVEETLFGDDAEMDAFIYSLYGDVLAGRVGDRELEQVLVKVRAYPDARKATLAAAAIARVGHDVVRRILIHLDQRSPTASFAKYGPRVVPIYNYFQGALVLFADGTLSGGAVLGTALEMIASGEYTLDALANSLQDLLRRGRLALAEGARLAFEIERADIEMDARMAAALPPRSEIAAAFAARVRALALGALPPVLADGHARIDYQALLASDALKGH